MQEIVILEGGMRIMNPTMTHLADDKIKVFERIGIDKLNITKNALDKVLLYPLLVENLTCYPLECYGYLFSSKKADLNLVTDIYLAKNIINLESYTKVSGIDVFAAFDEAEKRDCRVIGYWHNHGNFGVFHSSTDDGNMKNMMQRLGRSTLKYYQTNFIDILNECSNADKEQNSKALENIIKNTYSIESIRALEPYTFAYSLVVNNRQDIYCEAGAKKYCILCNEQVYYFPIQIDYKISKIQSNVFDIKEMREEVLEKIEF